MATAIEVSGRVQHSGVRSGNPKLGEARQNAWAAMVLASLKFPTRSLRAHCASAAAMLRGWTNYFPHSVSSATFDYLDHFTWWRVVRVAPPKAPPFHLEVHPSSPSSERASDGRQGYGSEVRAGETDSPKVGTALRPDPYHLKTHQDYVLAGGPGEWTWTGPEEAGEDAERAPP